MGCLNSRPADSADAGASGKAQAPFGPPPPWVSPSPMTSADLEKQRTDFWETYGSGVYGGQPVIWDALKAACSADIETARLICNAAGVVVTGPDLLVVYDERGALYELPPFVLSPPTNLVRG